MDLVDWSVDIAGMAVGKIDYSYTDFWRRDLANTLAYLANFHRTRTVAFGNIRVAVQSKFADINFQLRNFVGRATERMTALIHDSYFVRKAFAVHSVA